MKEQPLEPKEPREKPERDEMDAGKEANIIRLTQQAEEEQEYLDDIERSFIDMFEVIQNKAHLQAIEKGWWDDYYVLQEIIEKGLEDAPLGTKDYYQNAFSTIHDLSKIALIHSEQGEATEGLRHGNPPDQHLSEYTSEEVEDADTIIRIMDKSQRKGNRLGEAIIAKMRFNATRPHKHGKLV